MKKHWDVIIAGGGVAGYTAARTIAGEEGDPSLSVLLVGGEDRVPYKRTKLSKHVSSGFTTDEFNLSEHSWYESGSVRLIIGNRVVRIDPERHTVRLETGEEFSYGKLLLATGSDAVLPAFTGETAERIRVVRTASQVERLRRELVETSRVLVVGTGVLGVEISEQASLMGKRVILAGRETSIMGRELNATASGMIAELFSSHGVELRFPRSVLNLVLSGSALIAGLSDGEAVSADTAVFCIGSMPNTLLAREAGLRVNRGIVVDAHLLTSNPDIYAAGDAAEHPGGLVTGLWHAAELQGKIAGLNIAGKPVTYDQPPFRMKCEVFGEYYFSLQKPVAADYGRFTMVEDRHDERKRGRVYRCFYFRDGVLSGVVMVNDADRARLYEQAVREHWTPEQVDDGFFP